MTTKFQYHVKSYPKLLSLLLLEVSVKKIEKTQIIEKGCTALCLIGCLRKSHMKKQHNLALFSASALYRANKNLKAGAKRT